MRRLFILVLAIAGLTSLNLGSAAAAKPTPPSPNPPPTTPPTATTGAATGVNQQGATLNGTVNPNGTATTYTFEFGTTTKYGVQTAPASVGKGIAAVNASAALTGLAPSSTYHYRLVATNDQGKSSSGKDATFTTATPAPAASRLALFGHTAFVSPSRIFGVFVGCFGAQRCSGNMTVTASGRVIGHRSLYLVGANDGGIVHVILNRAGRRLLAHAPRHHLVATATVKGINGTVGQTAKSVTIVPFS